MAKKSFKTPGLLFLFLVASSQSILTEETKPHTMEPPSSQAVEESEKAPFVPSSPNSGWFVGVRGAYIPSLMAEVGYQFNQTFKLRFFGSGVLHYAQSLSIDGQAYNSVRFKPMKYGIMADWYLWKNDFRVTAGFAYNGDKMRVDHQVTGTLLGEPASSYGTITANYNYRRACAPYLGIGYDVALGGSAVSLSADAGVWFQGKVRSDVELTGPGKYSSVVKEKAKDHTQRLINQDSWLKTVPMVSIGLRYIFNNAA